MWCLLYWAYFAALPALACAEGQTRASLEKQCKQFTCHSQWICISESAHETPCPGCGFSLQLPGINPSLEQPAQMLKQGFQKCLEDSWDACHSFNVFAALIETWTSFYNSQDLLTALFYTSTGSDAADAAYSKLGTKQSQTLQLRLCDELELSIWWVVLSQTQNATQRLNRIPWRRFKRKPDDLVWLKPWKLHSLHEWRWLAMKLSFSFSKKASDSCWAFDSCFCVFVYYTCVFSNSTRCTLDPLSTLAVGMLLCVRGRAKEGGASSLNQTEARCFAA